MGSYNPTYHFFRHDCEGIMGMRGIDIGIRYPSYVFSKHCLQKRKENSCRFNVDTAYCCTVKSYVSIFISLIF